MLEMGKTERLIVRKIDSICWRSKCVMYCVQKRTVCKSRHYQYYVKNIAFKALIIFNISLRAFIIQIIKTVMWPQKKLALIQLFFHGTGVLSGTHHTCVAILSDLSSASQRLLSDIFKLETYRGQFFSFVSRIIFLNPN